ncbi:MAG: hypothetical protein A3J24_01520 [Deltaproteobacteria bacterium RIFCSPLOWO2_02_FULL_53_8]|nr:MAG: hypothetical protein A3J24_01520 [Deltaproteobacteria bacterium RIFCSPLOWO2_02_FULL_53_8]
MKPTCQQPSGEFKTRDLYLAVVLKSSGIPIARLESSGPRAVFVFKETAQLDEISTKFFNRELRIEPRSLFDEWRSLKSMAFVATGNVR